MKHIYFLFSLLISQQFAQAQDLYLVELKPKENTAAYFANPLQMLSQRAINRRTNRNVSFDEKDVPINATYIQQIKNLNLSYIGASKWLNTIMVEIADDAVIDQLQNLSFVQNVQTMVRNPNAVRGNNALKTIARGNNQTEFNYGYSSKFIDQLNLSYLHQLGFTGQNIMIGVIDSGFPGVNVNSQFSALRNEGRLVDTYNFVNNNSIYQMDSHGAMVLSNMAAKVNNTYVGTAPDASYALYVSEDAVPETPKELMYWIQAAERADSVGVDVINTSLGYTTFDDPRYDYTYQDMNGTTTLISKGATVAASRGIFVVNAMGNDGGNSWHYISAPADAADVFSIGANMVNFAPAGFSSYGPNSVGVLKPNVSALGAGVPVVAPSGSYAEVSGTSFASPIMAGSVATLMSAFPNKSINELKLAIEQSAHLYPTYNTQLGYGVPDFSNIYNLLKTNEVNVLDFKVTPNPATSFISVQSKNAINEVEIYSIIGSKLKSSKKSDQINIQDLKAGVYLLKVIFKDQSTQTTKLIIK